jgi:hypothetical protein
MTETCCVAPIEPLESGLLCGRSSIGIVLGEWRCELHWPYARVDDLQLEVNRLRHVLDKRDAAIALLQIEIAAKQEHIDDLTDRLRETWWASPQPKQRKAP